MIKRLRVQNFKSLRDVDLEFGRRNVLVGPNMSGKSNLLGVFRFLTSMVTPAAGTHGLLNAFQSLGGFWEVAWKGSDSNFLSIRLEGGVPGGESPLPPGTLAFDYEISVVGSRPDSVTIQEERLVFSNEERRWDAIGKDRETRTLSHPDGRTISLVPDLTRSALEFTVPDWSGNFVRELFASFRFYALLPAAIRVLASPSAAARFLQEAGQNLASWLLTIQTQHKEWFERIEMAMRDAFPEIESLFTVPTQQSTVFVSSKERFLRRPTSVSQMSDGELAFLAMLSLIYAPPELGAPLYCVEEPENHLHPRLLEMLVQLLKQRQRELPEDQRATVILSTHSPHFVDQCDLDEIIVVEKRDGATVCTRPRERAHLRELLERKELGLGDLFYSGALDGG